MSDNLKPFRLKATQTVARDFLVWGCSELAEGGIVAGQTYTFTPSGEVGRDLIRISIDRSTLFEVLPDSPAEVASAPKSKAAKASDAKPDDGS